MAEITHLEIKGMHCVNCPTKIEKALSKIDGINEIDVSWENQRARVTFEREKVTVSAIIHRISKMDFEAKEIQQQT